jgi:pyruvate/2-oxoglutarate dehydrogenase complex dihydrolipoamide dehydrogenase (E3) component
MRHFPYGHNCGGMAKASLPDSWPAPGRPPFLEGRVWKLVTSVDRAEGFLAMTTQYDAIVIGTGQSGPSLARRLTEAGRKVAVIERKRFGGTCVNTGCIPTKSLVASARAAHVARRGSDFGVVIDGSIRVDMKAVKARKDAIVRVSNEGVEEGLRANPRVTVHVGHARFVGPKRIEVNGGTLEAEQIFINVGGRADVPPIPGIQTVPYLTNSSMMEVDFLPEHLVILGGSYIGLEFGQMYRRFGSEVTVIQRNPHLIPREDEDVSVAIRQILEDEGIRVLTDAGVTRVESRNDQVAVSVAASGEVSEVIGSHLLVATGRRPNTDDLGLDKAGVEVDERGYIKVDGQLRTNVPGVFAMGDCNGRGAFTHTSYNDFEIIAANLFEGEERRVEDRITTYGLFIDPPLGRAGMTETEVRRKGIKALVAKMPMEDVSRAYERSETKGFMKIIVDAETKLLLGAALLGIEGDEIVQGLLDMMYAKAPYTVIRRAMHIHPTVYEMIPYMFDDLQPVA